MVDVTCRCLSFWASVTFFFTQIGERDRTLKALQDNLEQIEERSRIYEEQLETEKAIIQSLKSEKETVEQQVTLELPREGDGYRRVAL